MSKIISTIYFHLFSLFRSSAFAIPLIVLLFLQMMLYMTVQNHPAQFFSHIFLAEIFAFVVAIWLGFISHSFTNETTEQLLILRLKSDKLYYCIYACFLFIISFFVSLITIFIPTILSFTGFFEQFSVTDFCYALLLFTGSNFAGITLGAMIHPRIMRRKEEAPFSAIFVCLVAITSYSISLEYPLFRFVLWVLPNVSAHNVIIESVADFTLSTVVALFLISVVYGFAYSAIRVLLLARKKF